MIIVLTETDTDTLYQYINKAARQNIDLLLMMHVFRFSSCEVNVLFFIRHHQQSVAILGCQEMEEDSETSLTILLRCHFSV